MAEDIDGRYIRRLAGCDSSVGGFIIRVYGLTVSHPFLAPRTTRRTFKSSSTAYAEGLKGPGAVRQQSPLRHFL